MNAAGIIFSNLHDINVSELTRKRTMASIPFACRYRLIDFALSNMVNAEITNINVITQYNYHSLTDHIGTGKDWDLARRKGGIKILPPYINSHANVNNTLYASRLDALKGVYHSINHIQEDYIVLSDCDVICNIDIKALLKYHIDNNADITMVVKKTDFADIKDEKALIFNADENNQITDVYNAPVTLTGEHNLALNIWVINRNLLINMVSDGISHGLASFSMDILAKNIGKMNMQIYQHQGYSSTVGSFSDYFKISMELLENPEIRNSLFAVAERPIFTKVRNSAPTKYVDGSSVSNSLIADGCIIEGTVDNCILFRGVKIGKGAVVKNSILFQDTVVSEDAYLNCIVTDKNAVIREDRVLSGHETMPVYVEKGRMI
ncbi:MAG: glucose-1-phosphate adenylyltransferase subunit GlgD [Clostridia bacterium]|nr:glucose-1-phosphate adenylyltransferase subunit GlgD [Clostridia bacterium]